MKLDRLASTTQRTPSEAKEQARAVAHEPVRRVEAQAGIDGDRERSVQQEMASIDPRAIGPFEGGERIQAEARAVAERLVVRGGDVGQLLNLAVLSTRVRKVDESA